MNSATNPVSFVYVISPVHTVGPCKVGWTKHPNARISFLQTGNPHLLGLVCIYKFPARYLAERVERKAHSLLAEYRLTGEWFEVPARDAIVAVHTATKEVLASELEGEAFEDALHEAVTGAE